MNECMEIDKPLITIVMAVYEPNMQWLKEQLLSLEAQTYPNLELIIRDDCSPTVPFEQICECVATCIRSFPYEISRNERNVGSNQTFEWLTQQARGEYIAYCDQDDVWLPKKLQILEKSIAQTDALLVCSDMYVIDGQGNQAADSITKVRRHHVFRSGENLTNCLLVSNFVTGCTMLVKSNFVKTISPFCPYMVHDHYISLCASIKGEIVSIQQPLIRYRIHGFNQTGILTGVVDKESYETLRIDSLIRRYSWIQERFSGQIDVTKHLLWVEARKSNWEKQKNGKKIMWKYRSFAPLTTMFEFFAPYMPDLLFEKIINAKKKNWI